MQHQRSEIFQKLQLYKTVIKIRHQTPNYSSKFLSSIITEAWGQNVPKKGVSLAKKYLQNQFTALQKNKSMQIPKKCEGYGIIAVSFRD